MLSNDLKKYLDFGDGNLIHPTAIIGSDVKMGTGNVIGPYCVLNGWVTIGNNNFFDIGVVTYHKVDIGNSCKIYPYASLGFAGEMGAKGDNLKTDAGVVIENNVTIREYVNVHSPFYWESTKIGSGVYIMNKSYIGHDVQIGNNVMINANVSLGGRAIVHDYANIGMGASVHQKSKIGMGAMVGMNSAVKASILPYSVVIGTPARILRFNKLGAKRQGYSESEIQIAENNYMDLVRRKKNTQSAEILKIILEFLETNPNSLRTFYCENL